MSKRLNVYKDQKLIYDIVMESSFDKLQEEVSKFHLEEHKICLKIPALIHIRQLHCLLV